LKALILFGTRNGFTRKTAEVLAKVLAERGYIVDTFENKVPTEKIKELNNYNIVLVGSSIMAGMWKFGVKRFIKKYGKDIKGLYLFVSAGGVMSSAEKSEKTKEEAVEDGKKRYIEPLVLKYSLTLKGSCVFGGQMGKGDKIIFNNWNEEDIKTFANSIE
jgi:menaquinone-dependent protoporphyrinogen IX oxidase